MAKALITGGTGFVGSHVARLLHETGHQVRVLHRVSSRMDALSGVEFESALGDVLDEAALRAACDSCDWVFHVAAVADYWQADQTRMFAVNIEGTRRVLRAARDAGVKRVVFTSSAASLGYRWDGKPANEQTRFNLPPHHFPYGYSKLLAEQAALYAVREHHQEVVIVNPVVVMGPGDLNMISGRFITEIARLGWLVPVTSGGVGVVDVRDVARWQLAAAENGCPGERYILGTANYSFREWYGMVANTVGVRRPFIPLPDFTLPPLVWLIGLARRLGLKLPVDADQTRMGARNIFFDYEKTWTQLGLPQVEMFASLRDTYMWYQEHGYI
ncbi:MAG: NAD-dependent epimerase/dehydratase family protein [Anaerolineae bacterium]|nr:NAD-dependent epimerase/dehydratase family protein [Anaerolineae bacterium]